jgi:hypothetical protein
VHKLIRVYKKFRAKSGQRKIVPSTTKMIVKRAKTTTRASLRGEKYSSCHHLMLEGKPKAEKIIKHRELHEKTT